MRLCTNLVKLRWRGLLHRPPAVGFTNINEFVILRQRRRRLRPGSQGDGAPDKSTLKMNVDMALQSDGIGTSFGGLLQNSLSEVVGAFYSKIPSIFDLAMAECLAIC